MSASAPDRSGFSALEALVALLLGLFVAHLALSTLARVRTVQAELASRADGIVAMRVARHVLRRELGHGLPGEDWWVAGDSIGLRAFRGTALVCEQDPPNAELTVVYGGDRRPDPAKDSVLFLHAAGRREVRALVGVWAATGPCPAAAGETVERWRLDAAADPRALVGRLFERGSYHLSSAALRYRRGASGRQPLTPEIWSAATGWRLEGGRLGIDATPLDTASGPEWSAFLAWGP